MDNQNQNKSEVYQPRFLSPEAQAPAKKGLGTGVKILLCALAAAVVVGGGILAWKLLGDRQPEKSMEATTEPTVVTEPPETEPPETVVVVTEPPEPLPVKETAAPYEPDEELVYALSVNPEIVGRITYGDVDPQYLVQTNNNSYYLSHDAFGNYDSEGAAFFDCRCSLDPRDTNIMVHGHNMNVGNSGYGKAFATLFRFRNKEYVGKYPIFKLETAEDVQYYVLYALPQVETCPGMPGYYPIVQWNFTDDQFYAYTGFFRQCSLIDMPVRVQPSDKLMTFSTCINDGSSATELRLLCCLRQLRQGESVEYMEELYGKAFGVYEPKPEPTVQPKLK